MNRFLVTGASSPLGLDIASVFTEDTDNQVLLTSRKDLGLPAHPHLKCLSEIDLLEESDLERLTEVANQFFDGPFHVINCVGYYANGQEPFLTTELDEARRIFDGNFVTVYNVAKYIVPLQIEKGGGHFIGFSCNSVRYKYPWMAPYTSSKAALETFIGCLANEHYQDNIIANVFAMATLQTDAEKNRKPKGDWDNWLPPIEIGEYLIDFVSARHAVHSGNVVNLYKFSESFFNESYFERIKS